MLKCNCGHIVLFVSGGGLYNKTEITLTVTRKFLALGKN